MRSQGLVELSTISNGSTDQSGDSWLDELPSNHVSDNHFPVLSLRPVSPTPTMGAAPTSAQREEMGSEHLLASGQRSRLGVHRRTINVVVT
ncbi:MAG: hypothetical protein NVSMB27_15340 [Ktedonobacteraceae bacterium]